MSARAASTLAARWNGFWFAAASPLPLALFRLLFAVCLAREVETTFVRSVFAMPGGFHLPYADWIPLLSPAAYRAIHHAELGLVALLAVGLFTRTACALLLVAQSWVFFADQLNFRNHPYFFLLLLAVLAVSPAGRALSVDAWLRRPRLPWRVLLPAPAPVAAQRLIQVQVSLVYLWAAAAKLDPAYLEGHVLRHLIGRWLAANDLPVPAADAGWIALAAATIAVEVFLAVALWSRRLRPAAIAVGIAFHLSIAVTLGIWAFSLATIASYLLFLDPATIERPLRSRLAADRFGEEEAQETRFD